MLRFYENMSHKQLFFQRAVPIIYMKACIIGFSRQKIPNQVAFFLNHIFNVEDRSKAIFNSLHSSR